MKRIFEPIVVGGWIVLAVIPFMIMGLLEEVLKPLVYWLVNLRSNMLFGLFIILLSPFWLTYYFSHSFTVRVRLIDRSLQRYYE